MTTEERAALDRVQHYVRYGAGQGQQMRGERGEVMRILDAALRPPIIIPAGHRWPRFKRRTVLASRYFVPEGR